VSPSIHSPRFHCFTPDNEPKFAGVPHSQSLEIANIVRVAWALLILGVDYRQGEFGDTHSSTQHKTLTFAVIYGIFS